MRDYILSCCSTADLEKKHFQERDIHYVCFHFEVEGQDYRDDLGESMPFDHFYTLLQNGADVHTSQVSPGEFVEYFRSFLKQGKDILHVSLSSGLSGSYNSAKIAQGILQDEFPDQKIYLVDSKGASSGYGLLMEILADKRDEGYSLEELVSYAEETKMKVHHWFYSTDLQFYVKGGRISQTAANIGGSLHIYPLLHMDGEGHLVLVDKIHGKKKLHRKIIELMKQHAESGLDYHGKCKISHSMKQEEAEKLADMIEETFPTLDGKVEINTIGTTIGAHTGPGTIAVYFVGDRRDA